MSALNHRTPRRSARKPAPVRPLGDLVRLEDRTVPDATLIDVARGLMTAGAGDAEILGATPDGRYAIFSSEATDLVIGQVDVPGTRDLFWVDFLANQTKLVTASPLVDPTNPTQYLYSFNSSVAFGYSFNTVEAFSQAVISDDGKVVAFTSKVNVGSIDSDYATSAQLPALAGVANKTVARDRGDASYDVFRWDYEAGGKIQLASRTYDNAKIDLTQAFGSRADAINPAISGDGSKIAFVSARDATAVYPRATGTTPSYIIDSDTPSDDLFMVDFEKIIGGDPQNTTVVSQIANPYLTSTFIDETGYFWVNEAATFGFAGSYAPVVDTLFYQLVTITNPDGTTTTQFTGAPIRTGYAENVKVDTAGRYMSSDGNDVAFVSNINPRWTQSNSPLSNVLITDLNYSGRYDVYRSTVVDVGALQAPDHINASIVPGSATATLASGGGTADNVILSRDTGDRVVFPANTVGTQIVAGATSTQGVMQLYFRPVTRDGALDAVILTAAYGTIATGVPGGLPANAGASLDSVQIDPLSYNISNDGNFAVFTSSANGISNVANTGSKFQVYRRDTRIDTTGEITTNKASRSQLLYIQTVSVDGVRATSPGNNHSQYPSVSGDGRFVSYQTLATNVVVGGATIDVNGKSDIAVRDYAPGATDVNGKAIPATSLVSLNAARTATGNGASTKPIQTSGRVLFTSLASDLITGTIVITGTQHGYSVIVPPQVINVGSADVVAVGGGFAANATLTSFTGNGQFAFGSKFTPFPGFTGEIRVASGDVDGDGTADLIAGAGPGGGPRVVVISGSTGAVIRNFFAFESSFRGGVTVAAADFNGFQLDDGGNLVSYTDVIIGADEGGGARVQVWDGKTGVKRADVFAYEATFRGGVRVAAADVNGDGTPDIVTGAGFGGGPRVSAFDGVAISAAIANSVTLNTAPVRVVDFFAFEATLRNGVYVGGGDIDADGFSEVVVGGGPGGGPRVTSFDGRDLAGGSITPTLNFFAFPSDSRDGVRVAVRNIDGVGNLDVIAGQGTGQQSRIKSFSGDTVDSIGAPSVLDDEILFGDFGSLNGAWVG